MNTNNDHVVGYLPIITTQTLHRSRSENGKEWQRAVLEAKELLEIYNKIESELAVHPVAEMAQKVQIDLRGDLNPRCVQTVLNRYREAGWFIQQLTNHSFIITIQFVARKS